MAPAYRCRTSTIVQLGRWLHIEMSREVGEGDYTNPPGNCAGPKLLATGHKPVSMTEMWFRRTDRDPEHVIGRYRQYEVTPGGVTVQVMDEAFPESGPIGSCNTCQDLIFMTMCPEKNCP